MKRIIDKKVNDWRFSDFPFLVIMIERQLNQSESSLTFEEVFRFFNLEKKIGRKIKFNKKK